MCNYSRNPTAPAAPSVSCFDSAGTTQDGTFAGDDYGFASESYWSSSEQVENGAWDQSLRDGSQGGADKDFTLRVRPIRSF
jgi:hypothetical protein